MALDALPFVLEGTFMLSFLSFFRIPDLGKGLLLWLFEALACNDPKPSSPLSLLTDPTSTSSEDVLDFLFGEHSFTLLIEASSDAPFCETLLCFFSWEDDETKDLLCRCDRLDTVSEEGCVELQLVDVFRFCLFVFLDSLFNLTSFSDISVLLRTDDLLSGRALETFDRLEGLSVRGIF